MSMTKEQSAAYVSAMVTCAMIEAMGMQADNAQRTQQGESIAWPKEAFDSLIEKYGIYHNAVVNNLS